MLLEVEVVFPPGDIPDLKDELIDAIANQGPVYLADLQEARSLVRGAWRNYITRVRKAALDEMLSTRIAPKLLRQSRGALNGHRLRMISEKAREFVALLPSPHLRNDFTNVEAIASAESAPTRRSAVFRLLPPSPRRPRRGRRPSELPDALLEFFCIFRDEAGDKGSYWKTPPQSFVAAINKLVDRLPADLKGRSVPAHLRAPSSPTAIFNRIRYMHRNSAAGRNLRKHGARRA
jgi:hypothetical protein